MKSPICIEIMAHVFLENFKTADKNSFVEYTLSELHHLLDILDQACSMCNQPTISHVSSMVARLAGTARTEKVVMQLERPKHALWAVFGSVDHKLYIDLGTQ